MILSPIGYIELSKKSISEFKNELTNEINWLNKSLERKSLSRMERKATEWKLSLKVEELKQITSSPSNQSLLKSVLVLISFNFLKSIAEGSDKINVLNRLNQHKKFYNHSLKCAKTLSDELLNKNKKKFRNKELFFNILNCLIESKKITKDQYDYWIRYHPGTWNYHGFGFDGRDIDNINELISERVHNCLKNSDHFISTDEGFKKRKSELIVSVSRTVFETYLRDLGDSIDNGKEWDLPIDDWNFARNLIDFTINKLNPKLCISAYNPILKFRQKELEKNKKKGESLTIRVITVVKKYGVQKFQNINGKNNRANKLIELLESKYDSEIIDPIVENQRKTISRYASPDWIESEVVSRDKK